jgi:uncharacterized protein YhaN
VKIKRLLIRSFGCFINKDIPLKDGLNIIYGENEAGKSTIHDFIEGILFSFKKPDSSKRSWSYKLDKYRPWGQNDYAGSIIYEIAGRSFRLEREFEKNRDTVRLFDDLTGEELTYNYNEKSNREREIMEEQLGINLNIFQNTISISQLGLRCGEELIHELKNRLSNINEAGSEDISIKDAYSLIKEARNEIGTYRQPSKEHYKLLQIIENLKDELEKSNALFASLKDSELKLKDLNESKKNLEKEYKYNKDYLLNLGKARDYKLYSRAKKIEKRLRIIEKGIKKYSYLKGFPVDKRDEFLALKEKLLALEEQIQNINAQILKKEKELDTYRKFLDENSTLEGLDEEDLERLKLTSNGYYEREKELIRKENSQKSMEKEIMEYRNKINIEYPGFTGLSFSNLKEFEEKEDYLRINKVEILKAQFEEERDKIQGNKENIKKKNILILSGGIIGFISLLSMFINPLFSLGLIPAVILLVTGIKSKQGLVNEYNKLEESQKALLDEINIEIKRTDELYQEMKKNYQYYAVSTIEELRSKFLKYNDGKRRLDFLEENFLNFNDELKSIRNFLKEKGQMIIKYLNRYEGEDISINKSKTEDFINLLKEYLRNKANLKDSVRDINELKGERDKIFDKKNILDKRIKEILDIAKLNDFKSFEEEFKNYNRYIRFKAVYNNKSRELKVLLGDKDLNRLEEALKEINEPSNLPSYDEDKYRFFLEKTENLQVKISNLEREISSLETEINTRLERVRNPAEIEEELYLAIKKKEDNESNLAALDLAEEAIQEISRGLHREFAPILNKEAGEIISHITDNKYREVKISPQLEIKIVNYDGSIRDINVLSSGTIDQFYFSIRIAIASLLTRNKSLPLFLDEAFVQFDYKRLKELISFLSVLSKERQIIVFTCHMREIELTYELGLEANIINL